MSEVQLFSVAKNQVETGEQGKIRGFIENMPSEEYHAKKDYLSNSMIGHFLKSPAHFQTYLRNPPEATAAQELGTLIHACILEPKLISKRYVISPGFDRRTKAGKQGYEALVEANPGKIIVTEKEYEVVNRIVESVYSHESASSLLKKGITEPSLFWQDSETGVYCKARPDFIVPSLSIVVDIKTTDDASLAGFQKSISKYAYNRQLAYYTLGARACGMSVNKQIIIAVEKVEPYAVAVYQLDRISINFGDTKVREALFRYARCLATDSWPAYSQNIQLISLPEWMT